MSRAWTETERGWQSGPYRIELEGPRRWVVTHGGSRQITTVASLRVAKQAAERAAIRRTRLITVRNGVAGFLLAVAVALAAPALLPKTIGYPIMVAALFAGIRCMMAVEGALTSKAWLHRADAYQ